MAQKSQPPKIEVPKISREVLLPKIINGAIAGMVGVSIVFPLDLVKTRLQNQTVGPGGKKQYKNMLDCFRKTYKTEGFLGMYRGVTVNILLISPERALKLASNDVWRILLSNPDGSIPIHRQMLAGGLAGTCPIVITTPMELLKIQMQDAGRQLAEAKAAGSKAVRRLTAMELTKKLVAERGFLGLYKGIGACAFRDITFAIIYFPLFALFSKMGKKPEDITPPFWWSFISGCAGGSIAALAVTPCDVVKTRFQTIVKSGARRYSSIMDCVTKIMKHEGPLAFFKGGACRMIVIAPLYGIAQTVYYIGIGEYLLGYKRTTFV